MSATPEAGAALEWRVNGLRLTGLAWGDPADKPLLALHGWLDNAASYAQLGPLLDGYYVVALDLTGHGRSDWRSADASYQIWDDLPEILGVADALGWPEFCLMGHSRGAIIAALLASSFPDRVKCLALLDGVSPAPLAAEEFPAQLRQSVLDKVRLQGKNYRVFGDLEQAMKARGPRLSATAAEALVQRNLRSCDGGYTWSTDPRLHGASAVKLGEGQVNAALGALLMPTLLLAATSGVHDADEMIEYARKRIPSLYVERVDGGHHFHLEQTAAVTAVALQAFFDGSEREERA